jgi:hypothetical protein
MWNVVAFLPGQHDTTASFPDTAFTAAGTYRRELGILVSPLSGYE